MNIVSEALASERVALLVVLQMFEQLFLKSLCRLTPFRKYSVSISMAMLVMVETEVQALAETFGEDKQSSIEQEQELSVQLSWEAGWLELADDTSHLLVCK